VSDPFCLFCLVQVFNCSEGLDYQMMAQLFSGLVQSGAYACFDEFNRIEVEVLSVVAQQLLTIQTAIMQNVGTFLFEGRELKLNAGCGFFITMNPGYAGRTELPDNLKALFRPVAMTVPDSELISEILLFTEGFVNSKVLASKLVKMYRLCAEQLSPQVHYDFGLRSVKSVLNTAGALKRENPNLNEELALIQALRATNAPKFLPDDLPLFNSILTDLFPGFQMGGAADPISNAALLQKAIADTLTQMKLEKVPYQVEKIVQLHDTIMVRHGVMLVGPTGGGKTTCYNVLANAMPKVTAVNVETHVLNPKALSINELYGVFEELSREWTEGLVAHLVRTLIADSSPTRHWIIFDGPVDALWIENMNSVLDDNKMLCLANGERMSLTPNITMIFEVDNLNAASPATVSRCGMIYVEPENMGWRPAVVHWLNTLFLLQTSSIPYPAAASSNTDSSGANASHLRKLPVSEELRAYVLQLFDKHVEPGLKFVRQQCREEVLLQTETMQFIVHSIDIIVYYF
jgi:dynein heavy chain